MGTPDKRGELRIYLGCGPHGVARPSRCSARRTAASSAAPTSWRPWSRHTGARRPRRWKAIERIRRGVHRLPRRDVHRTGCPRGAGRHPEVVLVDELAHSNTPGSKNAKRWQDVEELLTAGITVISTVNVQHLESLNDVVAQITGIEQQTVPDSVVRAAQIELVDITPEALRRRLSTATCTHRNASTRHCPTTSGRATSPPCANWRCCGWPTRSTPRSRNTAPSTIFRIPGKPANASSWRFQRQIRDAGTARIAHRLKSSAELMVVHVVRGDGLTGVSAPQMGKVRELTASLGATLHTVVGGSDGDVPSALLDFAREMNATQLVLGTSRRSRWAPALRRGHRRQDRPELRQDRRAHGHP